METTTAVLEIHLFGPMRVTLGEDSLPRLRSRTGYWLLALLALRLGRNVSREWLAATLWPDSESSQAFYNLRRLLTDLRQALGPEQQRLLAATPKTVTLKQEGVWVDANVFDAALALGDIASLRTAITLYRGALLEGCAEEWVIVERALREQQYLSALEKIAAQAMEAGNSAEAIPTLRLLVAADPLHEENQRALMQALADCGDMAAVTQVYRDLRLLLHRELNAAPAPETERLFLRLAAQEKQPSTLADLPTVPRPPVSRRLPVPVTPIIGRENQIEEVIGWLKRDRLMTLLGTGGVGKTRLALAVGEKMAGDFADGVWFVELASLTDPALVPQMLTTTLGIPAQTNTSPLETLLNHLTSRSLLLILDNCEHLLDACAFLADRLLSACSEIRLLTTSRQPLSLRGERSYLVPSLELPENTALAELKDSHALLEYSGIRLFVERSLMVLPTFRLTRKNARLMIQICRQLDALPLAIELAATRMRSLTLEEIAARLERRFELLTGGSRAVLPRHQTLKALIDWSYGLLTEPEQTLLRRLSVFADGWTLQAAEQVCLSHDATMSSARLLKNQTIFDILASLVEKSLVQAEDQEGRSRYRFLETVREYARERLEETEERETIRRRHAAYFLAVAEEGFRSRYSKEQIAWLDRLETEHNNLRAALSWCREDRPAEPQKSVLRREEIGMHLVGSLAWFWCARGHVEEGHDWATALLAQVKSAHAQEARINVWLGAGLIECFRRDSVASRAAFTEALALSRTLNHPHSLLRSLLALANTEILFDRTHTRQLLDEALTLSQTLQDRASEARVLGYLAYLSIQYEDREAACRLYEQGLAIFEEIGDFTGAAVYLAHLGEEAGLQGDYARAVAYKERALTISRALSHREWEAGNLQALGKLAIAQEDYERALPFYLQSMEIQRQLGIKPVILELFQGFALLMRKVSKPILAVRLWGVVETLQKDSGDTRDTEEQAEYDLWIAQARAALGEAAFEAAWSEGQAMDWTQAIDYALAAQTLRPGNQHSEHKG